jgi:pyrroloquinoline quinone biosynthesis protein B
MRVKLLGTAAGGAFPQWNCACKNCRSLREGSFHGKSRSQLQVAISPDGTNWVLLNASPDIRTQIEAHPALHPRAGIRSTPILAIVLTTADLDQILGLLQLREFQKFQIYATRGLQLVIRDDNSMFAALNRTPGQVSWINTTPSEAFSLPFNGKTSICCTPVSVGQHFPSYVSAQRRKSIPGDELLLGLMIKSSSGRCLAYFPSVPAIDAALQQNLAGADVVLFDGTFWSDEELCRIRGTGETSLAMGHVPIWGPGGSIERLSSLKARKIYVHINNTNPMLDESGPEYGQAHQAGWEIAEDGWEFEL